MNRRLLLALIAPAFLLTACVETGTPVQTASPTTPAVTRAVEMREVACSATSALIEAAKPNGFGWPGSPYRGTIKSGSIPINHGITVLSVTDSVPTVLIEMGEIKDTILGVTHPPLCYTVKGGHIDERVLRTESKYWNMTYTREGDFVSFESRLKNPSRNDWVTRRTGRLAPAG